MTDHKSASVMQYRVELDETTDELVVTCRCENKFETRFAVTEAFEFTTGNITDVIYPDVVGAHNQYHS